MKKLLVLGTLYASVVSAYGVDQFVTYDTILRESLDYSANYVEPKSSNLWPVAAVAAAVAAVAGGYLAIKKNAQQQNAENAA